MPVLKNALHCVIKKYDYVACKLKTRPEHLLYFTSEKFVVPRGSAKGQGTVQTTELSITHKLKKMTDKVIEQKQALSMVRNNQIKCTVY